MDPQHGTFDDIGGRALHGGIDRASLRVLAALRVALVDLRQIKPSPEYGRDVALGPRPLARLVHVALHAGIALEVEIDITLRLAALDAELTRQAERRHAVDQAEVDRLRGAALIGGGLVQRHAEDLGRGRAMDTLARGDRRAQALVPGQVRHEPELDLRVIRGDEPVAGCGDERLPDLAAFGRADRDVLQI